MRITVTNTASNLAAAIPGHGGTFLVQNPGAVDVYLARTQAECTATDYGTLLPGNTQVELRLEGEGYIGDQLWALAAGGTATAPTTADIHVMRLS